MDYQDYENVGDWAGGVGTGLGALGGLAFGNPALGGAIGGSLGGLVGTWAKGQGADLQRKRIQGLPQDPAVTARANELYGAQAADINKAASGASEGSASAYARRGLAHSGMGSGAQGNIALQAGQARAGARLGANSQALQEGMQREMPMQQQAYQQYGQAQGYQQGYLKDLEKMIGYSGGAGRSKMMDPSRMLVPPGSGYGGGDEGGWNENGPISPPPNPWIEGGY